MLGMVVYLAMMAAAGVAFVVAAVRGREATALAILLATTAVQLEVLELASLPWVAVVGLLAVASGMRDLPREVQPRTATANATADPSGVAELEQAGALTATAFHRGGPSQRRRPSLR